MVLPIVIAIALASLAVMVVMLTALVRHVRRLAGAAADFQRALEPVLAELQADAQQVADRAERVAEERERLADKRLAGRLGDRARRRRR